MSALRILKPDFVTNPYKISVPGRLGARLYEAIHEKSKATDRKNR